jgi:hypothetical protein
MKNTSFVIKRGLQLRKTYIQRNPICIVTVTVRFYPESKYRTIDFPNQDKNYRCPALVFSSAKCFGKIVKVCFYFFRGKDFRVIFLPRNGSEWNSEIFLYRGTTWIPSELTIFSSISSSAELFFVGYSHPYFDYEYRKTHTIIRHPRRLN